MSADQSEEAADTCCASCGKSELDDVKLKECNDCKSVRYCSDNCQQDHRLQHEAKCRDRATELRNEILFRQPESSYLGDCPICFLPLPIDTQKSRMQSCCSKSICIGCSYAHKQRQWKETGQQPKCPFCRHPVPETQEEADKMKMKRATANDPVAIRQVGFVHSVKGKGNRDCTFKYWKRAAEMGDAESHFQLSLIYMNGEGVEKDEKKAFYHMEEAAIRGHPGARHNIGVYEGRNERFDRAVKHWIIAAKLGHDPSIQALKECYKDELVSKEDFAAALRAHHAAVEATKSPQREEAAKYYSAHA